MVLAPFLWINFDIAIILRVILCGTSVRFSIVGQRSRSQMLFKEKLVIVLASLFVN